MQEHLILQLPFSTDIFLANELSATPLSFLCVLKRRVFINRLFYGACSTEKSQDLICPKESISFDSVRFHSTFRFSSLCSRDFVPEARWLIFWATIARAA